MSLLNLFEYEIMRCGGIANLYDAASLELSQFEKDPSELYSKDRDIRILDIKTGRIFKNCSVAARSINVKERYFQNAIKMYGQYLSFIKVA